MPRVRLALVLWLWSLLPGAAAATPWPHEASDLAVDPAVTWGVLPNGLRNAIRPNAEPQDRVSLRFLVLAGSLHENDRERGLAHFLEHMAFRSTRNHPDGSLVAILQRLGIGFGPDNTAFTTHDYTIYHLELPDPSTSTLSEALGVFREYADGIALVPAEIDRERGVVLSELATRNVPESRAQVAQQTALLPRARQVARLPIGLEGQIRQFQSADCQAFYDAWYRPERMILVLVGAVDPAQAEKMIAEKFSSLTARGEPRPEPPGVLDEPVPLTAGPHLFKEPGIIGARIVYERAAPAPTSPNTREHWQGELRTARAFHMLQRRLYRMGQAPGASFTTSYVFQGDSLKNWRINTLVVNCSIVTWNLALREAEQELRRALKFGFTDAELADARVHFRTFYEQGARSAATQRSEGLATALANAIAADRVFSSSPQIADLMLPWLDQVTLAECDQALRAAWSDEPPMIYVVSNSASNATDEKVTAAYAYARRVEVMPPVDRGEVSFAYTDFGPAGTLVTENEVADLDLWLAKFANGVRFNFKATDFEDDTVLVSLRVGHGLLSQPKSQPGLALLATYGFLAGGVGRHDNTDLSTLLNGHVISLNFRPEDDAFVFSLKCAPRELTLGLQLLAAILSDSAYRPESVRAARSGYGSLSENLNNSPSGPIYGTAPHLLAGGDHRFGVPTAEVLTQRTLAELRAWLDPELRQGPVEISVVGDVDRATATTALAQTLGALPDRAETRHLTPDESVKPPPAPKEATVWNVNPALRQVALAYYFPVTEPPDVHVERRCHLLAEVLEERLRQRVREQLGVAYSVTARFSLNEGFPAQSFIEAYAEVATERADEADRIIRRELTAMVREGITADEFDRAKQPFVARRSEDPRRNGYWAFTVLAGAQDSPRKLAAARDRTEDNAAIAQREVQALIDRYLVSANTYAFRTTAAAAQGPRRSPTAG